MPHRKKFHTGMMYMLISAVGLSFFTLFAKLGNTNIPFMVLTWLRFFVPLLLVLPFLFFSGSYKTVSLFHIPSNQILRSLCVCVAQYSIFYYLTKSSLLNATVLLNTGPLFIPILERIFYKHEIEKSTWVSLFLCLAGVIFILQPDRDILSVISLIGLIAGLGQAGSQVLYGKNAHKEKNDVNLFYLFFLSTIFSLLPLLLWFVFSKTEPWNKILQVGLHPSFVDLSLLGLSLATIVNQVCRGMAYRSCKPSTLAPFLYVAVLVSAVFDFLVFGSLPNYYSMIGAILVVVGGLIKLYHGTKGPAAFFTKN